MSDYLETALQKLGLTTKETKVYLAALELGPSPVQNIAQRAGVPRATTYLVLGDLRTKGLITTFTKGKKAFFAAASPEQLNELLSGRAEALREQERTLTRIVPELLARGQFTGTSRPVVHFYEGARAIRGLIRENLRRGPKEILSIFSTDDADRLLQRAGITPADTAARRKRAGIQRRAIYTWHTAPPSPGRVQKTARYIPFKSFPITTDITVIGNRVVLFPYDEPVRGVAIEDASIASGMRVLFDALWSHLEH